MSSSSSLATSKASTTIPYLYRFLLLNVESVFAFGGVILALTAPGAYLSSLTQERITTADPLTGFIYTQLAGGWMHIAFCEFFILRLVDDLRVWKLMCTFQRHSYSTFLLIFILCSQVWESCCPMLSIRTRWRKLWVDGRAGLCCQIGVARTGLLQSQRFLSS